MSHPYCSLPIANIYVTNFDLKIEKWRAWIDRIDGSATKVAMPKPPSYSWGLKKAWRENVHRTQQEAEVRIEQLKLKKIEKLKLKIEKLKLEIVALEAQEIIFTDRTGDPDQ